MPSGNLLAAVKTYLPPDRQTFVEAALEFATRAHAGQSRKSGEPYIEHPIATAEYLAAMRMDATTLASALLHDVMEDCGIEYDVLAAQFGRDVAKLVDGVTKLKRLEKLGADIPASNGSAAALASATRAASTRKMLVAMAQDVRVILIKLADRLHNMRTLGALPKEGRARISQETLDIYAPLAHRLGMWDVKWRLEDEAFRHLMPREYKATSRLVARKRAEREAYVLRAEGTLKAALDEAGVNAQILGRPKHLYSVYQKIHRYAAQGKHFDEIYDLIALRVIVDNEAACYAALGVVHGLWRPVPGQFDDYIASPKDNMYRSLHTSVICLEGSLVEIQIRTKEMHRLAEDGVAAHWAYKEGALPDDRFEQKMSWLKQLIEWQREVHGDDEYLDSVKTDILRDQVFVYTPVGEVKDLPAGATPLDFAYRIHTDIGHSCVGAVVNGKLTALNTPLKNGDTVEIRKAKVPRGPSLDWLNPNLGYLTTASAREKVRQWFRRQERHVNIERGRDSLRKEMRRLNVTDSEADVADLLGFHSVEDLAEALGTGQINAGHIAEKLGGARSREITEIRPRPTPGAPAGVVVMGIENMLTRVALCCNPVYGEEIMGYLTRNRGVTVHRHSCPNLRGGDEPERLIEVAWGRSDSMYPVRIRLDAYDRVGLLRDITSVVSAEHVNIHSMYSDEDENDACTVSLTVYTTGIEQLSRLFAKLEAVPGVRAVTRMNQPDLHVWA